MKTFLLLVFFASVTFGQSIEERVKNFEDSSRYLVRYDKFDKITRIAYPISEGMIVAQFHADNRHYFYWYFKHKSGFFNRPTLKILIDDKLTTIESEDIDTSVLFPLSVPLLESLAKAEKVEYQVRPYEGDISSNKVFKNLLSLTKPLAVRPQ